MYLGNFGSREPGTEQEPKFSVSVLFGSVLGNFGSVLGFRFFVPRVSYSKSSTGWVSIRGRNRASKRRGAAWRR
jgi:hypothetical protein